MSLAREEPDASILGKLERRTFRSQYLGVLIYLVAIEHPIAALSPPGLNSHDTSILTICSFSTETTHFSTTSSIDSTAPESLLICGTTSSADRFATSSCDREGPSARASSSGGGTGDVPPLLPALIECLHAGSLVIDDIEDNSTHRRGREALHRLYGVPLALNSGNWLYFWPFEILARTALPASVELALHRRLEATLFRCHVGQALDLGVLVADISQDEIAAVVATTTEAKSGGLTRLAIEIGAIAAEASDDLLAAIGRFGASMGVGLQRLEESYG